MDATKSACSAAPKPSTFDYFTERYYHQYIVQNCKGVEGNNCRLLVHSNGLCVLCLDESHAAVRAFKQTDIIQHSDDGAKLGVSSVVFGSGRGNSRMAPGAIQVVGKRKKNAIICQEDTKVCIITMTDGTVYSIPACIDGFVLELNPAIMERPELIVQAPTVEGYIAVISPNYNKLKLGKYTKVAAATGGDIMDDDDDMGKGTLN
ncbi:hypothetical protein DQ04_01831100 [Trypanosoma grayi]|uniref:hypothetical protein n=1 Tax=Trypanosoma grayi TaxID=71804 RepID=UPI0004F42790|nr:hypothetical protein DQ04_01831100 [Trypanosoma grayi]KEG12292.1 hypothetical protein DQ04_01831100 [Trypanosoma grayi]